MWKMPAAINSIPTIPVKISKNFINLRFALVSIYPPNKSGYFNVLGYHITQYRIFQILFA